ncbi:unnamed protein product [Fusarium graminearum]|nr:unnamed protein product [Fusarium graminearum]CAG1963658.1 unnamed protein product [Fusarium graminearum]
MPVMDGRSAATPNRNSYSQTSLAARLDRERRRWSSINDQADFMSSSKSKGKGKAPAISPEQKSQPESQPESQPQSQPGPSTYRKPLPPRTGYDADVLREMCDTVRTSLHEGRPEPRWEEVMGFLKAVLRDEGDGSGSHAIEIETIRNTHLDKLISDILNPRYRHPRVPTRFAADIQLVERLERKWIERFRGPYFHIEEHRYRELSQKGRLRDVTPNLGAQDPEDRWQANDGETLSEMEGNLEIEPGHWWLNLACAHRDGIVDSNREKPTKGKYGVAALPLLTGQEDIDYDDGAIRYVRQGRIADIHVSLISQVGATFRILRGYHLRSPFAPKAGIRYDGLYTIRRYSQWFNEVSDRHHMMLTLERVSDQRPIEDILNIPRPSEIDDWNLYQKYESELALLALTRQPLVDKMGKNDKKGADKGGKAKGGDKGKDAKDTKDSGSGGKAKGAQSINVRHILCEKHAKKEEALAKLNDGVKFDEVAREYSEDKARQGGSLGWKTKGSLDPKFEEVAFALETSTTNSPKFVEVKTGFGYHIIMVEGRK